MAIVTRTRVVTPGGWRTLETFWHASAQARFVHPAGVQIKVRYGVGFLGWDSQLQRLDGTTPKTLTVGVTASSARAQMQAKVTSTTELTYTVILSGP